MKARKDWITLPLMVVFVLVAAQGICLADTSRPWKHYTVTGKVVAVDQDAREITLKDWTGSTITFAVDPKVGGLGTIAVGEKVTGHYCIAYTTDFRRPTAEELETPFVGLGETVAEPDDATPGTRVRLFRDVMSINGIDTNVGMINLKNSRGETLTVFDAGHNLIDKARVYKTLIATYTQPLIVSIEN